MDRELNPRSSFSIRAGEVFGGYSTFVRCQCVRHGTTLEHGGPVLRFIGNQSEQVKRAVSQLSVSAREDE